MRGVSKIKRTRVRWLPRSQGFVCTLVFAPFAYGKMRVAQGVEAPLNALSVLISTEERRRSQRAAMVSPPIHTLRCPFVDRCHRSFPALS